MASYLRISGLMTIASRIAATCTSLVFSTLLFAQSEFAADTLYQFTYQLVDSGSLNSSDDARLQLRIYAYDHRLADVSAVVLKETHIDRPQSNLEYQVTFTGEDLGKALQQYHGSDRVYSDHDAGVYLIWTVDINGDSQICEGDLRLDYNKMPDLFYGIKPRSAGLDAMVTVFLTPVPDGKCRSFE